MSKFVLEIETGNAAFHEEVHDDFFDNDTSFNFAYLADKIAEVGARIRSGDTAGRVRDFNGNTVGKFEVIP